MDPIDLYRALLERNGLTTNSLARSMLKAGLTQTNLQSHLHRWERREAKTPSMDTLGTVARYFKVDARAFYDPSTARAEAARLGFTDDGPRAEVTLSALDAIKRIRELVERLPETDRTLAAEMMRSYLADARESERKAQAICDMLEDGGPAESESRKRRAA